MNSQLIFYLALGTTLFCLAALAFSYLVQLPGRATARRVQEVTRSDAPTGPSRTKVAGDHLLGVFHRVRLHLGMAESVSLRSRFVAAGLKRSDQVEIYLAVRLLGPIAGIIGGTFFPTNPFMWAIGFAAVAYLGPDFWLERRIKKRRERIRKALPDAVDLLVICVDAGLGLDQAILRAGQELSVSHPEINEEFMQINREQRAGRPRIEAWKAMAERTKLPDVQGFVSMLTQTERFGTPIARALDTFSDGMRQKRRQVAEEKAAKTSVKMLFPLVLFIFPCIFIVLLGPAFIAISKGLFSMTH